ncbi:tyrosine-type recombinase/integrase [Terrihabitans sp. B22-R8]|uniref:tyrosine-type recombinase/integrase n=1 Tax=Terrihabitans sp. B22-R8 TaxID=3425128 RepID=UPI00403C9C64
MGRRSLIELKYVQAFRDRHGTMRYYFRRNGIRRALPGQPGSSDFMEAYAAALDELAPVGVKKREAAGAGTFAALAACYYGSTKYLGLSPGSRTNYRRVIDGFLESHGHRRVDQMKREHVDAIIGRMSATPGAAIILLKRIRILCRYAIELGWHDRDPTAGAKSFRSTEIHTWTEDEIGIFEERWPAGSRERLTFSLLLYTGQRGSDVYRMTWADIAGDSIRVAQQKTGTKLVIPLHPNLRAELALAPKKHACILATAYGASFSLKGFGQMISAAIVATGLPSRCKAHGLRKAAARRLAECGATEKEIASITGHKTLAEVERYTRAANQEHLAKQAMEKQAGNRSVKPAISAVSNFKEK